jgi:hypothetical protein
MQDVNSSYTARWKSFLRSAEENAPATTPVDVVSVKAVPASSNQELFKKTKAPTKRLAQISIQLDSQSSHDSVPHSAVLPLRKADAFVDKIEQDGGKNVETDSDRISQGLKSATLHTEVAKVLGIESKSHPGSKMKSTSLSARSALDKSKGKRGSSPGVVEAALEGKVQGFEGLRAGPAINELELASRISTAWETSKGLENSKGLKQGVSTGFGRDTSVGLQRLQSGSLLPRTHAFHAKMEKFAVHHEKLNSELDSLLLELDEYE